MSNKKNKTEVQQKTQFDKFIDDQILREKKNESRLKKISQAGNETPQQKYNRLYRERPQNRTFWRKK